MPAKRKIYKEDIINASLNIIREKGMDGLNARKLAKKLGCSTQPIFYIYPSMDDIKKDVLKEVANVFDNAMMDSNYDRPVYKDIGRTYIKFAQNEPEIFKLLFNSDYREGAIDFIKLTGSSKPIFETISKQTGLSKKEAEKFHLKMWLYVNGIANLVLNNTCNFTDDEIDELLREQYISMVLLEIDRGNIKKEVLENVKNKKLKRK